MLLQEETALL
jgi:hypothetical protein